VHLVGFTIEIYLRTSLKQAPTFLEDKESVQVCPDFAFFVHSSSILKPNFKHMPNLITNFDKRWKMFYEIGFVPIITN
jgi:hypothetical protein